MSIKDYAGALWFTAGGERKGKKELNSYTGLHILLSEEKYDA